MEKRKIYSNPQKSADERKIENARKSPLKRRFPEYEKLAKKANRRMLAMERAGETSPAWNAAQAKLAIYRQAGEKKKDFFRFPENRALTYNEMQIYQKTVRAFLESKTGTLSGYRQYRKNLYEKSNAAYGGQLSEYGITEEEWLEFWRSMPANHKDRMYGSDEAVKILQYFRKAQGGAGFITKSGKRAGKKHSERLGRLEPSDIAEIIQDSKSLARAYQDLGLGSPEKAGKIYGSVGWDD